MDLYHKLCNSRHGEKQNTFEELNMNNSNLSRMDVMEGDDVHFDIISRKDDCELCKRKMMAIRKFSNLVFVSISKVVL